MAYYILYMYNYMYVSLGSSSGLKAGFQIQLSYASPAPEQQH